LNLFSPRCRAVAAGRISDFGFRVFCFACSLAVFSSGILTSLAASLVAEPTNYLAGLTAELRHQWPANRIITIVCHGHSVPAGYFKTPMVDTFNAYPHLLHHGLKERFPYAVINVTVTAIGGEDSESGAKRFEQDVLSLRPDVVTIDYALNDRRIGLERAATAWRSMITSALARHIKVILLTPTPDLAAHLDDPKDPLNRHAAQIRGLAAEFGVGLVDSLEAFRSMVKAGTPLATLMAQGNHPNRLGHELVVAELFRWFPKE
jgi:acyl-CoA thioesterase I